MRPMPRSLFLNETRIELGWPWTSHADARGGVLQAEAAVQLLRSLRRSPAAMEVLRSVLGDELSGYRVARLPDDRVIEQLAWRVRSGWLHVAETQFATSTPPVDVTLTESPVTAAPPPPAVRAAPPPAVPLAVVASNPDCFSAFTTAATNATPLVERGGVNCS